MLIRVLPAFEAPEAQRNARDEFAARFADVTCCPLPEEFARQWWPRADAG